MSDVIIIERFAQLISNYTGLRIRAQDREAFGKKLWSRINALKLSSLEQYYQLLEKELAQGDTSWAIAGRGEWKELLMLLTVGESYFFRDKGQFWLLKHIILPEAIAHQRQIWYAQGTSKPSLRLWSAGCSTGEEPYSLAILLTELIPDWEKWDLLILGTDINPEAIAKAKQGSYNSWSFRLVEPEEMPKYFHRRNNEWVIREKFRKLVTFQPGNLVSDRFPDPTKNIANMNLIICRNVFVYFDPPAIATTLEKFYQTLRPGGYLISAHAELHGQNLGKFRAKVFPQSVVYQRGANSSLNLTNSSPQLLSIPKPVPPERTHAVPPPFQSSNRQTTRNPPQGLYSSPSLSTEEKQHQSSLLKTLFGEAQTLFRNDRVQVALQKAQQVVRLQPRHFGANSLIAEIYANLGDYQQAEHYCKQAIAIDSLSVEPYYLMARIAEEKGDVEKAKYWLKRIIYLLPLSITAYLELAAIYQAGKDMKRANKMRKAALEILQEMPAEYSIDRPETVTAGELRRYVQNMLDDRHP